MQKGNLSLPPFLKEGRGGFFEELRPPLGRERKRLRKEERKEDFRKEEIEKEEIFVLNFQ